MATTPPPEDLWKDEHETILVDWADKAMCYRWMHGKSHEHFSRSNMWFTIPVIILSTITGTANFAQERIPENYRSMMVMIIGGLNIFAGVLTTIQQFLKITESNEAHRVASISWDKFHRNIRVELCKSPPERIPVRQMLKVSKEEFDRLMETSPVIAPKVAQAFQDTFQGTPGYAAVVVPDICGVLRTTAESKYVRNSSTFQESFVELHGRDPLPEEMVDIED